MRPWAVAAVIAARPSRVAGILIITFGRSTVSQSCWRAPLISPSMLLDVSSAMTTSMAFGAPVPVLSVNSVAPTIMHELDIVPPAGGGCPKA